MDWKTYRKFTIHELVGRRVRTLTDLANGYVHIPAGSVLTILSKRSGLELIGDRCPTCGILPQISRVDPRDVELL